MRRRTTVGEKRPRRLSEVNVAVPRVAPNQLVTAGLAISEPIACDGAAGVPASHSTARVATPTQHTRPLTNAPPPHPTPFRFDP
jgi:hypothetical protein